MWPDPVGPGWIWDVLMAGGLFAVFLALVWLAGDFQMPHHGADSVQAIWRRYEHGDLTRQEFERAKREWSSTGTSGEILRR
jgi:hypothetical protein